MFEQGFDLQDGPKSLAAIIDAYPDFGQKGQLFRTRRALQGWSKVDPQKTRPPIPWPLVATMVMMMLRKNQKVSALAVMLMFTGYLRPGETLDLQRRDLVPPMPGSKHFALHLHPAERHQQSKVGLSDESMLLDSPMIPWLGKAHTGHLLQSFGKTLEEQSGGHGTGPKPLCVVSTSTFRAEPRSSPSVEISTRSKTKGKMGLRCNSQKVRSSCTNQPGVSQLTSDCAATMSSERTTPSPAGPKIFQPQATLKSGSRTIVIELFSGCARLSKACANQGFQVYAYDIDYGQGCNLLDPLVKSNLKKFIKKNASRIALVWMGTPCTTWSRARKLDGGPPPLRDDSALEGLPNLSTRDAAKILEGTQLRDISAEIALLCFMLHIAWVIENPFSSRIWLCESFSQLRTSGADLLRTDFCAYHTPWRKSTGFLVWNFPALKNICSICTCQQGRCSFSGRKHIILSGKDASGQWMTRRAQPYPNSMFEKIAIELHNSF